MNDFEKRVSGDSKEGLHARAIDIIQVNLGLLCNQACRHCHLECSPDRTEVMEWPVMEMILDAAKSVRPRMVDLTGGAPELNARFRGFIKALREGGHQVQVRTNLTVLLEPGMEDLPELYRELGIHLTASMPCYLEENVRAQRGEGVYEKSVEAIRRLNASGFGLNDGLPLNLVYNPGGAFLPGNQADLEQDYKRELGERFGITFTNLLTITNLPMGRFRTMLKEENQEEEYMVLLESAFNALTVDGLMCRHQISVAWDGTLYDCDFNMALRMAVDHGAPDHIRAFDHSTLETRRIVTGAHCFGCTAGSGSSCGGALV